MHHSKTERRTGSPFNGAPYRMPLCFHPQLARWAHGIVKGKMESYGELVLSLGQRYFICPSQVTVASQQRGMSRSQSWEAYILDMGSSYARSTPRQVTDWNSPGSFPSLKVEDGDIAFGMCINYTHIHIYIHTCLLRLCYTMLSILSYLTLHRENLIIHLDAVRIDDKYIIHEPKVTSANSISEYLEGNRPAFTGTWLSTKPAAAKP